MPYRLAITLSVLWVSCVTTVMAEETRWQQYEEAGAEAYDRGDYAEAASAFQFALKEAEDFGEDPRFATTLNHLAMIYDAQGRYDEAEPMYKRALAIQEKTLGPEHPDTATSLYNLALLYDAQGRYDEAEPMYKRSIAICVNGNLKLTPFGAKSAR